MLKVDKIKALEIEGILENKVFEEVKPKVEELQIIGSLTKEDANSIGVVGSRKMSFYGKRVCEKFVSVLSMYGFTIVSGAMYGVDMCAHDSALKSGGRTLAVLGVGIRSFVKKKYSKALVNEITSNAKGAIISEFEPDFDGSVWSFPKRNRIVAALSRSVLVIEASKTSGSLITVDFANDLGKDIFVVPGSIFDDNSEGKHKLIKDGAILVETPYDILDYYGIARQKEKLNKIAFENENEKKVYLILKQENGGYDIDTLSYLSGIDFLELTKIISKFEVGNIISVGLDNNIVLR